jgi:amidase
MKKSQRASGAILNGLTFMVKDLFDLCGQSAGFGNPDWLSTHKPADKNAEVVNRLLDAGAELTGKTILDELAYSVDGINIHYGAPVNPQYSQSPERTAGGSSSGSASVVASGLADFALGTDTAGSVRIPASFCGIYGFRPTFGRISLEGVLPLAPCFDTVGWFARDPLILRKCGEVLLGEALAENFVENLTENLGKKSGENLGEHLAEKSFYQLPELSKTNLLVAADAFEYSQPIVRSALLEAVSRISSSFTKVKSISLNELGWNDYFEVFRTIQSYNCWQIHAQWITTVKPRLSKSIQERFDFASKVPTRDYDQACSRRQIIMKHFNSILTPNTVLCLPTTWDFPPLLNSDTKELMRHRQANIKLTSISSLTGLPQVTMPVKLSSETSTGLSLIAASNSDLELLSLTEMITPLLGATAL